MGVGRLQEIRSCAFIRKVLDFAEPYDLYLIHEVADAALDDVVKCAPLSPEERTRLRDNMTVALQAIHRAGLVHSDVQTSNILRVDGVWKLADLGAAARAGHTAEGLPRDHRFVRPQARVDWLAVPENDWWGLAEVLRDTGATEDELRQLG